MSKQPKNPFHPGEILLEEFLQPMGMNTRPCRQAGLDQDPFA
jgi:plasmid maintenance system antidote protein VapI